MKKAPMSVCENRADGKPGGDCKWAQLPLPLGERLTLDVDEACEINVKGITALLLAQQ
ncbi:MAG: hypothetical protein ACI4KR_08490 [Ruminiclostridium sp.]